MGYPRARDQVWRFQTIAATETTVSLTLPHIPNRRKVEWVILDLPDSHPWAKPTKIEQVKDGVRANFRQPRAKFANAADQSAGSEQQFHFADRAEFQCMMRDATAGAFDVIVLFDLDRLVVTVGRRWTSCTASPI